MKYGHLIGSTSLSGLAVLPKFSGQSYATALQMSRSGVFIGFSEKGNMPFFLDAAYAMNPHVFIAGMSGSGKTFLTKNIMLKLFAVLGHQVVLLDFTGEYLEFSEFANCSRYRFNGLGDILSKRKPVLLYVGLSEMKSAERIPIAAGIVAELTEVMRTRLHRKDMLFIILDEAWKLLLKDKSLSTLVREGRKYGTGMILASQLIEDMELGMLSNIATLFVFRMQNKASLKKLELNYQINPDELTRVQNLNVGQCLVVQLSKSKARGVFFLGKVAGLSIGSVVKLIKGGKMVEIEYKRLEGIVLSLAKADPSALLSKLNADKAMELHKFMAWLMRLGADRLEILSRMRSLGINDSDTADSFAAAVGEEHGVA